jgi:hypothetical protein
LLNENANKTYKGVIPNQGASGLATADQPLNFWRAPYATITATADSGRYIFNNLAPMPIITAAEIQFMKAEAAYRRNYKDVALAAYTAGINLSLDFLISTYETRVPLALRITPASRTAFVKNTKVIPLTSDGLNLSMIMLQKYIAVYGYGFHETWTDMRRFHYLDIDPVTGKQVYADFTLANILTSFNNGKMVYRSRPRYNSEYLYNIPALQSIGALASDYHTKEQWFMQP